MVPGGGFDHRYADFHTAFAVGVLYTRLESAVKHSLINQYLREESSIPFVGSPHTRRRRLQISGLLKPPLRRDVTGPIQPCGFRRVPPVRPVSFPLRHRSRLGRKSAILRQPRSPTAPPAPSANMPAWAACSSASLSATAGIGGQLRRLARSVCKSSVSIVADRTPSPRQIR